MADDSFAPAPPSPVDRKNIAAPEEKCNELGKLSLLFKIVSALPRSLSRHSLFALCWIRVHRHFHTVPSLPFPEERSHGRTWATWSLFDMKARRAILAISSPPLEVDILTLRGCKNISVS